MAEKRSTLGRIAGAVAEGSGGAVGAIKREFFPSEEDKTRSALLTGNLAAQQQQFKHNEEQANRNTLLFNQGQTFVTEAKAYDLSKKQLDMRRREALLGFGADLTDPQMERYMASFPAKGTNEFVTMINLYSQDPASGDRFANTIGWKRENKDGNEIFRRFDGEVYDVNEKDPMQGLHEFMEKDTREMAAYVKQSQFKDHALGKVANDSTHRMTQTTSFPTLSGAQAALEARMKREFTPLQIEVIAATRGLKDSVEAEKAGNFTGKAKYMQEVLERIPASSGLTLTAPVDDGAGINSIRVNVDPESHVGALLGLHTQVDSRGRPIPVQMNILDLAEKLDQSIGYDKMVDDLIRENKPPIDPVKLQQKLSAEYKTIAQNINFHELGDEFMSNFFARYPQHEGKTKSDLGEMLGTGQMETTDEAYSALAGFFQREWDNFTKPGDQSTEVGAETEGNSQKRTLSINDLVLADADPAGVDPVDQVKGTARTPEGEKRGLAAINVQREQGDDPGTVPQDNGLLSLFLRFHPGRPIFDFSREVSKDRITIEELPAAAYKTIVGGEAVTAMRRVAKASGVNLSDIWKSLLRSNDPPSTTEVSNPAEAATPVSALAEAATAGEHGNVSEYERVISSLAATMDKQKDPQAKAALAVAIGQVAQARDGVTIKRKEK